MGAHSLKVPGASDSGVHRLGATPPRATHLPLRDRTAPAASTPAVPAAPDLHAHASRLVLAALAASGLVVADLAAIWDCSETRARAKLDPTATGAPITLVDVLRLERRAPRVWAALVDGMREGGGGK